MAGVRDHRGVKAVVNSLLKTDRRFGRTSLKYPGCGASDAAASVLKTLHIAHPGATRCKQLAFSYIWWPGLDADIERTVQSCNACCENRRDPSTPVLLQFASVPWQRVNVDHAGQFLGLY